jgi:hypothetical protein
MTIVANPPPQQLRPVVHERIDQLNDTELAAVHRMLLQMEIERLAQSIGEGVEEARLAGKLDAADIQHSILEHRARHPYP